MKMQSHQKTHRLLKEMAFSAVMIALSVVLTRFLSLSFGWFRLGFGSIPIIISSLALGPIWGGIVGVSSDLIGALAFPSGAYFFGYTIDAGLQGVLPFLTIYLFKGRNKSKTVFFIIASIAIVTYASVFTGLFDSFKKVDLNLASRILIPIGFAVYFVALFVINKVLEKKTKVFSPFKREEMGFSLSDLYMVSLVNMLVISLNLLSLWNYLVFDLNYLVSSFTQAIIFLVNGILRVFVYYFVMNAIVKVDNSIITRPLKLNRNPSNEE